ncbi:MAG: 3-phosphoshikimate 1-carboxyvinyltransferase [Candidatus Omnitrophica bacterium]|nr:3-phosphoshikimate 1-carboxyvinyltransferase [Candidatus Omnitrophota bacterium]
MKNYIIKPIRSIKKEVFVPPDKSISHRAAIISSIASNTTKIFPFILSKDTHATLNCLKNLKVDFKYKKDVLEIEGKGLYFNKKGQVLLNAFESGTTIRILSGVLCGQKFSTYFDASASLRKRPMSRITIPLRLMGADIKGREKNIEEYPPLIINPVENLKAIEYTLPVASAQVKSAIILAAIFAKKATKIYEPILSRDHTERLLNLFKADLVRKNKIIIVSNTKKLISPRKIFIPSDFSSAAFFIVLSLITPNSYILLKNININPTRAGLLKVLKRMGANIKILNKKDYYEPYADILVKSSKLSATVIKEDEVPTLIDEIPIFCIAASFAKGNSIIYGAGELKVKESDRITAIKSNLEKVGVDIKVEKIFIRGKEDIVLKIKGKQNLFKENGKNFMSFSDHRIAMSMIVLAKALNSESLIDDIGCINKSFPQFINLVETL